MNVFLDEISVAVSSFMTIIFIIIAAVIGFSIILSIIVAGKAYKKVKQEREQKEREEQKAKDIVAEKAEEQKSLPHKRELCEYCMSRLNSKGVCPNCGAAADWSEQEK